MFGVVLRWVVGAMFKSLDLFPLFFYAFFGLVVGFMLDIVFHEDGHVKEREEDADDIKELRVRLRNAQRIILRRRLELEKMEEYLKTAEERLMFHVAGRWPRRVWRLYLILLDALRRRGAFKAYKYAGESAYPSELVGEGS